MRAVTAFRAFVAFAALGVMGAAASGGADGPQRRGVAPLTPASLVGSDSYDLYCSSCHGADGKGGGPVASALNTAPADLTRIACRNGGVFPLAQVRDYITGERRVTAHGTPDMPVWGATLRGLDPSEGRVRVRIDNLAAYIRSLQTAGAPGAPCEVRDATPGR